MHPTAYYTHGYGCVGWMPPYAPYPLPMQPPRWIAAPQLPPTPPRYPIFVPRLPVATWPYLPQHRLGTAVGYHHPSRPPAPLQYYHPPAPGRAALYVDYHSLATWAPSRSPSPDPYPDLPYRRLERIRPWTDQETHHTRLTVDPILALPEPPFGMRTLGLEWDLADNPIRNLTDRPENGWIGRRDLARPAVRDGSRGLERLVLVFAGLPRECSAGVEVAHTRPATLLGVVDADADGPWVTVYEVLVAIFLWLVSPIRAGEMAKLGEERLDAVIRAAEARRRGRDGRLGTVGREPYLKMDYLGERRRFRGVRPALRDEVPAGRRLGEVFVVELGMSE